MLLFDLTLLFRNDFIFICQFYVVVKWIILAINDQHGGKKSHYIIRKADQTKYFANRPFLIKYSFVCMFWVCIYCMGCADGRALLPINVIGCGCVTCWLASTKIGKAQRMCCRWRRTQQKYLFLVSFSISGFYLDKHHQLDSVNQNCIETSALE